MLDNYKYTQKIPYNLLCNAIKNNKLSHAYLFESNNNPDCFDLVMAFVKCIICSKHYTNDNNCFECQICERIDSHNYLEIKIIEPEGLWIKKDQMLDLQTEFSKKALEGNKKIYIIKDAEKMNSSTSNSILKFLEEPVEGIIAILITNNKNQMLDTIISRCQNINLSIQTINKSPSFIEKLANILYTKSDKYKEFVEDKNSIEKVNDVLDFIKSYETLKVDIIIYMKEKWHNKFKDREACLLAFELMINFYYDVLKYKETGEVKLYNDYIELIEMIALNNYETELLRKIDVMVKTKELIKYNLNLGLLMDKFIMDMEGV